MKIKLNPKIIKERCGEVSFKRGEAFYRNDKITIETSSRDRIKAVVNAGEDFHVLIEKETDGSFHAECSCPTLASFNKDCQHIAAVMLLIYHKQRKGKTTASITESVTTDALTEKLFTLFEENPLRSSGHQLHFEKRTVLHVEIVCKPVKMDELQYMFGIGLKVAGTVIQDIRAFLRNVQNRTACNLSISTTYDPGLHCFQNQADAVIQQPIQVLKDEYAYFEKMTGAKKDKSAADLLLIPPSSWERLEPLLDKAPSVKLQYDGKTYEGLQLQDGALPLIFHLRETEAGGFQLEVKGIESMLLLHAYRTAIMDGKLMMLKNEENQQLYELTQFLSNSGTNRIPIPAHQVKFFLEKVLPGLRTLGDVQLSDQVISQIRKTPLIAKLYLDRVKNRLLAGLEFHYENTVINPLDDREARTAARIVRDIDKENEILKLMEDSSFTKTDGGYFFQNEELEYEFLYHVLPKLEKLVQVYATTAVRNRILKSPERPRIRVKHKRERIDWLEFKFEMEGFPEKEIRALLESIEEKRKYYRLRSGSLMSLETREIEEIRRFLLAVPVQDIDEDSRLNVPFIKGLQLIDLAEGTGTFSMENSFRKFLDGIRNPDVFQYKVPKSLDPILRDYQKQGYRWMKAIAGYGFGGILADDMGLGKTVQSIAFIVSEMRKIRESKHPVLIVCPSSVTYNWLHELMKFAPEVQAIVMDGDAAARKKLQRSLSELDVLIISYPLLSSEIVWFEKQQFHTVFFDEAQAFKNPMTQTARAVKKLKANQRFALTGTPVENTMEELWSIFHVVFPELFGSMKNYSNLTKEKIARRIRPFLLRRVKEDVVKELPEKIDTTESVELLPEQKTLYAAYLAKLRHKTLKHLDKDTIRKNRIRILAGLTRLRQVCCHPALFVEGYQGGSAKFNQLMQILEEARLSGRRVLIFSQFTKMLEIIGRELTHKGRSYFYLDGQTPADVRVETCNRFNDGERDLFLISLKAGGTGLNLTGADTVILYDLWWNPAVEEQAADRAHRIGQKKTVQVIKLLTHGTIEEKMSELQAKKRNLIEEIIDTDRNGPTTLTEQDIRELLEI